MAAAKKAIEADPRESAAYFARARIQQVRGEILLAISSLEKAMDLNPNSYNIHHGLCMALVLAGRHKESLSIGRKGERLSPRDPILWATLVVRSLAYILLGDYTAALSCANGVSQTGVSGGGGYWPHALRAASLAQLGQTKDAEIAIQQAISCKPDLSVSNIVKVLPTLEPDGLDLYVDGLRKAGLPD
jgi:adenylate cyclase